MVIIDLSVCCYQTCEINVTRMCLLVDKSVPETLCPFKSGICYICENLSLFVVVKTLIYYKVFELYPLVP